MNKSTSHPAISLLANWLPVLLFAFGFWYFCLRILGFGLEYIPGDLGDARFINFLLEHGHQWVAGNVVDFWNAGFMYPRQETIAISDNMIGTLPIYSLWRALGMEQETAYQFWWLTICLLNYWITYLVVKKWFGRRDIAALAAFIFAFSVFNFSQLNYLQMTIRFMVPVVFYAAARMVETGKSRYLTIFVLGIVFQFYSVMYTGFFLAYFSVGFVIVYAFIARRWTFVKELFQAANWKISTLTITSAFLLMVLLMLPYLSISGELGLRLFDEVRWTLPLWSDYLSPNAASNWSFLSDVIPTTGEHWLRSVFVGILPLLLLVSIPGMWLYWRFKRIQQSALIWTLSLVICIIAVLFIRLDNGWTLYALIFKLPGMNSMRVLNRFMHVELLLLVLLAAALLYTRAKWIVLILIPLVVLDNSFDAQKALRTEKAICMERRTVLIEQVKAELGSHDYRAFAIVENTKHPYLPHIDAMMTSLYVELPTVNAYTSGCPDEFGEYFNEVSRAGLNAWLSSQAIDTSEILIIER